MAAADEQGFVCQAQKEKETPPILSNLAAERFDVCHFVSPGKTRQRYVTTTLSRNFLEFLISWKQNVLDVRSVSGDAFGVKFLSR